MADLFREFSFLSIFGDLQVFSRWAGKIDKHQSSRKRSAVSFLDPELNGEFEFQRIGRGFTNLCYETSGRRPAPKW